MTTRRLIFKIFGPQAVLFLVFVTCYVGYQFVTWSFESRRMKSEASLAMARFHDHFNKNEFTSACENEFSKSSTLLNAP
jgi:hypothetical protein